MMSYDITEPIFPEMYALVSFPCTLDIHTRVPRICITAHPRYAYSHTPDIHTLVPRIYIPSHPGYSCPRSPDIHDIVPRIL